MDKHQIKKQKKYYGFTLVELIIVITILAILATISFVSFSGYTKKGNDTKKLSNLQTIEKGLDLLSIQTGKYPNPDKQYGTGILEGVNLNYVGYVGEDISKIIKLDKAPIDNVTNTNYVYGVSSDFKKFQIATTFEDYEANILIPKVYAGNLKAKVTGNYKYPLKIGDKLYSLPSLIFVGNVITNTGFIVDGGENSLFDKVNNKQTTTKILEKITGSGGLILTGVTIPKITNKEFRELKNLPNDFDKIGIKDKDYLGKIIYGDKYLDQNSNYLYNTGSQSIPSQPIIQTINGECGISNNKTFSSIPTESLCNKGNPTVVGGTGPWTWSCIGIGTIKGTDDNCAAQKKPDCPEGYVLVKGNSLFGTNDFCIMKYESRNVAGLPKSVYTGTPWVSLNQQQALNSCKLLNQGDGTNKYHLITNNEWMTISRDIENMDSNWISGIKGNGSIYKGHTDNSPSTFLSASLNDNDGFINTGNSSGNQRRTFNLSTGDIIWDFSGNVWEHVNGTNNLTTTNGQVSTGYACGSANNWYSWYSNDGSSQCSYTNVTPMFYSKEKYGPLGNYNASNGMGRIYSYNGVNRIFIRGGHWADDTYSGIYSAAIHYDSVGTGNHIGFRCAFTLN